MTAATRTFPYGVNPHVGGARVTAGGGPLPLKVVHGAPSFNNLMDAAAGWMLARELERATGLVAAVSYKHGNPVACACHAIGEEAARRARHCQPVASSHDWLAIAGTATAT